MNTLGTARIWPYDKLFQRVMREGHLYPAPACGSPAIVWHMAIAPRRRFGDGEAGVGAERRRELEEARGDYDNEFKSFVAEFNSLAEKLQSSGRVADVEQFTPSALTIDADEDRDGVPGGERGEDGDTFRFTTAAPQALSFTLWWPDDGPRGFDPTGRSELPKGPSESDLRVDVQMQMHTGYATVTFILDVSKPYGKVQIERREAEALAPESLDNATSLDAEPERRRKIKRALNIIRSSMARQIMLRGVDTPRLPEEHVNEDEARDLRDAADYLFKKVWDEFVADFGVELLTHNKTDGRKTLGRRFADLRGHVMSVAGLETPQAAERRRAARALRLDNTVDRTDGDDAVPDGLTEREREVLLNWRRGFGVDLDAVGQVPKGLTGYSGFGDFERFDAANNEGHTILRALWPFIRRMSPFADFREIVGCGVMGWRGLYLSALGERGQTPRPEDETPDRNAEIPAGYLPELESIYGRQAGAVTDDRAPELRAYRESSRPVRFLIITKGEPHREQLGRLLERINSLETLRLFALRKITSIRNAGVHIELIGRQIDGLLARWSDERRKIKRKHQQNRDRAKRNLWRSMPVKTLLRAIGVLRPIDERLSVMSNREREANELQIRQMNDLSDDIDTKVIDLNADLDEIGQGGSGRISYSISRTELAIDDFLRLLPTPNWGDIDGWTSYPQFINRGVKPSFDFISLTGRRLQAVRDRLQAITETLQTATLISAAQATQQNTQTLERVAIYSRRTRWTLIAGVIIIAGQLSGVNYLQLSSYIQAVAEDYVSPLFEQSLDVIGRSLGLDVSPATGGDAADD